MGDFHDPTFKQRFSRGLESAGLRHEKENAQTGEVGGYEM